MDVESCKTKMIENCFKCKNCVQKRNKNYTCEFKHVNMGKEPYYPVKIPENAKWFYGSEVCKFEPK